MNQIISTILLSALPFTELRASIPIAIQSFKMNPILVFFLAIIGNSLLIFTILILNVLTKLIYQYSPTLTKFLNWIFEKTRKKTETKIQKYGSWALIIFVAIPLPTTGALTASLAAWLFGIKFKRAFLPIFLGIVIAAIIVTIITIGTINLL